MIVACIAFPLPKGGGEPATAAIALRTVTPPPNRTVEATVRVRPADAADNTEWMNATSWQGGGLVVNRMRRIAPGVYRTTQPLPVHGNWKTLIRLSTGRALRAVPVYLPADPQIPAPAVPARDHVVRPFVSDGEILQREARGGALAAVLPAYALLALIIGGEFAALTWGLHAHAPGHRAGRARRAALPAHAGRRPRSRPRRPASRAAATCPRRRRRRGRTCSAPWRCSSEAATALRWPDEQIAAIGRPGRAPRARRATSW